jgi:tetratricopeptide (TPR) repeat protein
MKQMIYLVGFLLILGLGACFGSEESDLTTNAMNAYRLGNYDVAIDCFDKLIQLNVTDSYLGRGKTYFAKKAYDKAIADFDKAIQRRPSAIAFQFRGEAYSRIGDYEKAASDYTQAIQLDPHNGQIYLDRANAYLFNRQFSTARIDCSTAIMLLSENAGENESLALAYCIKGQTFAEENNNECFSNFEKAIQISPRDYLPYYNRAAVFDRNGNLSRAIDDYSIAIKLSPTNASAYAIRALVYARKGDFAKGIEDCNRGINIDSNCVLAYEHLAVILAVCPDSKIRDGKRALENAKKACELTSWKQPKCLDTLAAAYAETGAFDQAITWEQKAIDSSSKDADLKGFQERLELYKQKKPFRILKEVTH